MVLMSLGEYEMARLGFLKQGRCKEPEAAAESNTGGSVRWVVKTWVSWLRLAYRG
jgi:hypothetical protein